MSNALRILRYHHRAAIGDGGMTGAIRRWSEAVGRLGARVTIGYDEGDPPAEPGAVRWAPIRHLGSGAIRVPIGLDELARDADLLVLHSGWTAHNLRAAAVARSLGVPYLLEPRGAYDPHIVNRHRTLKRAWWLAAEHRHVDAAVAIHAFFDAERAHLGAIDYRGPVVVAPNGVETPDEVHWSGGGGYLLWLGRFDPEHKGLDLLIDAVAAMPAGGRPVIRLHGPDWRGGKAATERLIARRDLGRWLVVGPAVYGADKRRLLVAADGFLYPSRWDACPNAVLEAVSIGVPTLCTPYPLGTHLARRGAVLLAEANVEALRLTLPSFKERIRTGAIGETGAAVVRSDFRWSTVAELWLDQVATCLGRHRTETTGSARPVADAASGAPKVMEADVPAAPKR